MKKLILKIIFFPSVFTRLIMAVKGIKHGKNLKLLGLSFVSNQAGAEIVIGDNVTLSSSSAANELGVYQCCRIIARGAGAKIRLGDNVGISGVTIFARSEVVIDKNTIIGANTKVLDNDSHPLYVADRIADNKAAIRRKPIYIGENCFIGCNALILKGTRLGNGCVVGAGSVVSGEFPANSVIAGNPARIVKTLKQ